MLQTAYNGYPADMDKWKKDMASSSWRVVPLEMMILECKIWE